MKVEQQDEQRVITTGTEEPDRSARGWWLAILVVRHRGQMIIVFTMLSRCRRATRWPAKPREMAHSHDSIWCHPKRTVRFRRSCFQRRCRAYMDRLSMLRTNGYLQRWYVDLGAHVKSGQLLAEIDTPEVNQQLRQALADLATAQANVHLAQITAERYTDLLKTDSVSKQDADNAQSDYAAKKTVVQSAQANVKRLEDLQSFEKIYAPFDGVITARNTDIGALIDSGSAGGSRTELFHIAQPGKLRVYATSRKLTRRRLSQG